MVNARRKGKRGELEAVHAVREHLGLPDARRTQQVDGGLAADIHTEKRVHVEVKRRKAIAVEKFMRQAEHDADPGKVPVVVMRQDEGEWILMLRLERYKELALVLLGVLR